MFSAMYFSATFQSTLSVVVRRYCIAQETTTDFGGPRIEIGVLRGICYFIIFKHWNNQLYFWVPKTKPVDISVRPAKPKQLDLQKSQVVRFEHQHRGLRQANHIGLSLLEVTVGYQGSSVALGQCRWGRGVEMKGITFRHLPLHGFRMVLTVLSIKPSQNP